MAKPPAKTDYLSPSAAGQSVMFLIAVCLPARTRRRE